MFKFYSKMIVVITSLAFLSGCTSTITTQQLDVGVSQKESLNKKW